MNMAIYLFTVQPQSFRILYISVQHIMFFSVIGTFKLSGFIFPSFIYKSTKISLIDFLIEIYFVFSSFI